MCVCFFFWVVTAATATAATAAGAAAARHAFDYFNNNVKSNVHICRSDVVMYYLHATDRNSTKNEELNVRLGSVQ